MMKGKVNFLVLLFLAVMLNSCQTQNCPPPKKNNNIPAKAVWKGGCDGGYWIMINDTKENYVYDVIIYLEDGEIEFKNQFVMECQSKIIKADDLIKLIDVFDGEKIITTIKEDNNQHYCLLTFK